MKSNVLFLCHDEVTWNCFSLLYNTMKYSEYFNPIVITFPVNFDTSNQTADGLSKQNFDRIQHELLDSKGIPHWRLSEIPLDKRVSFLKSFDPQYIITAKVYNAYYQHGIGLNVEQFCSIFKTVYIPYYGATITTDDFAHFGRDGHKHCWRLIGDSKLFETAAVNCGIDKSKIIVCGHPKVQEIYNVRNSNGHWPLEYNGQTLKVIWAPHWSLPQYSTWLNDNRPNKLRFGTFTSVCWDFYNYAAANSNVQIVLKPHPLLQTWMRMHGVHQQFLDFIHKWESLSNTHLMMEGLYNELFAASDLLITDGCSFLTEYPIATGKPVIFIDSGVHDEFNAVGLLAEDYSHIVHQWSEIEEYLSGKKILETKSADALLDYLLPLRENTTLQIVEELWNGHKR